MACEQISGNQSATSNMSHRHPPADSQHFSSSNYSFLTLCVICASIRVGGIMFSGCPSVHCPSVNTYLAWGYISVLREGISLKLGTDVRHVSGSCWKGFQGERSKVKVMILTF